MSGFHIVVMVVKIGSRSFSTTEIQYNRLELKIGRVII